MQITLPLEEMSVEEKIEIMENIWDDLCKKEDLIPSPAWHKKILLEREAALQNGEEEFMDWETAKEQIRDSLS